MKNKKVLKTILTIVLSCILMLMLIVVINRCCTTKPIQHREPNFPELTSNTYKIETDMRWLTMMNDGGSHTNEYYYIDFSKNTVSKVWESYKANLGGTPETTSKVFYEKEMNTDIQAEIKIMLGDVLDKEDVNETRNYHSFTISTLDVEKTIYNEDTIKEIKEVLRKIDAM